jgi:hypothetical protein
LFRIPCGTLIFFTYVQKNNDVQLTPELLFFIGLNRVDLGKHKNTLNLSESKKIARKSLNRPDEKSIM